MTARRFKYVILGAGPTGLGAARRLSDLNISDYHVFEASDHAGGLASSFLDDQGFTWDIGGHVHFSHYKYYDDVVDEALGSDGYLTHVRNSQVWIDGRFVPYPFQMNIHRLPAIQRWQCFLGLARAAIVRKKPKNFHEHIVSSFGQGIADAFMLPYNRKVWAYPPESLSVTWVGERVATVNLGAVLKSLLSGRDASMWGPNNTFRFPKRGGSGAIWRALADKIGPTHLTYNARAARVDSAKKTVEINGEEIGYERLISSIPLNALVPMASGLPDGLADQSRRLTSSSTHVIGIGLKGPLPERFRGASWMYFPSLDLPFYRLTVLSNYSPHCVPEASPHWSLMAEISESSEYRRDHSDPVGLTVDGLRRIKFLVADDLIVSRWYKRVELGYPTPTLERDPILSRVQPELERRGIYSRGRFGGWKYEASNQDHSFMQGVEMIDRLETGKVEVTYTTPDIANSRPKS